MSIISGFYPPYKPFVVCTRRIWPWSSTSIHKPFLSLGGYFGDPWSPSLGFLISRDTRVAPGLIQQSELLLQNRLFSSFPMKHVMSVFIIAFQLWIHYLHPRLLTEDFLWDGTIWGSNILCHINVTSERLFNKLFREYYKWKSSAKMDCRKKSSRHNPFETHYLLYIKLFFYIWLCNIFSLPYLFITWIFL